ncbi:hypothetical protein [Acaryochloris marina]|uniref:Uncharacterized protein n=1 Tax=Acaryochloris marina (strain MBIC 11017) TaxID=329726 RepID=B0C844_ACAM1|nr:hypothetical protein [Acaryochloris marina]ABW27728.1 hypothetical protein AM1_2728 [Acaryochloris marina MBIC11017]BDM82459.1 hypothetical protein AM10699_53200 [Acaryochloris marina MBIC10699]
MVNIAQSVKLMGLIGCSSLLVNCTLLRKTASEPDAFRLEAMPIEYESLASKPAVPMSKVFQLSFYDYDFNWKKVIKTVDVAPLQYRGNEPQFALDNNGREYLTYPVPGRTKVEGKSVLTDTPLNWYGQGPAIVFERKPGTVIMPLLPDHSYKTVKAEIESTGGKVLGIFGTTFKGFTKKKEAIPLSYVYFNPNRLPKNAGQTELPIYRSSKISGQSAPNILLSGLVTYADGRSAYLDFSDLEGEGKTSNERLDDIKGQIRKELEQLEAQPDVAMVTIDTHGVIRKPEDIEAVLERGEYKRGGPFMLHETQSVARGIRVFDEETKAYVGSMITPSLLMKDCLAVAKQRFGEDAVIQFLDGDAPAAAYFEDYDPTAELELKDPIVLHAFRLRGAKGLELIVQYD